MTKDVASVVNRSGFAFIQNYSPNNPTRDVVGLFGTILELPGLSDVQILKPHTIETSTPNIYSGNFGFGTFPLHTDLAHWYLPPRYLALRCIVGGVGVATHLTSAGKLIDEFGEVNLFRTLVQPRRPMMQCRPLLRILEKPKGIESFIRWDSIFITPATQQSTEMCRRVGQFLSAIASTEITLEKPGDLLIIDNWRVLHGRSEVPVNSSHRHIDRVYLGVLH